MPEDHLYRVRWQHRDLQPVVHILSTVHSNHCWDASATVLRFLLLLALLREPSGTTLAFEEMMKKSIVMPEPLY